ncbi:MAG: HEAT repeat domain-containing protein [Planctomycetota bacterium]
MDLRSPDPLVIIAATRGVASQKNMEAVPYLIQNLRSTDAAVRMWSILALTHFTGGDRHGYASWGALEDQEAAVERWEQWFQQRGGSLHTGG